jgi:Uma2 family endonuclease
MKAAEFYAWVHSPENRHRLFELDRGQVVELPRPGRRHGFVCANIAGILGNFAAGRREGYVCTTNAGVLLEQDPDTVLGPDVSFYEDGQTAADMDRQYAARPPVLAVEVQSQEDRINRTIRRITQMLRAGFTVVWLVDPEARDVSIYRAGQDPVLVQEAQELTGEPALPDFRSRVANFLTLPGA